MSLTVICPTRGRPDNARDAYRSFLRTRQRANTHILFAVDEDDPSLDLYRASFEFDEDLYFLPIFVTRKAHNMAEALNEAAKAVGPSYDFLGFIGDDHRFRTQGWDHHIVTNLELQGGGLAYANDLMQSENLPTQVFMNTVIVENLGWMALPGAHHLYLDNAWKDLGEAADCLYYFPDLVIEHMHFASGKAPMDEGYARVNSGEMYTHDAQVFNKWKEDEFERDVWRVREALARYRDAGGLE